MIRHRVRVKKQLMLSALTLILLTPAVRAHAGGQLDPTFGSGGKAIADFGVPFEEVRAMAIQPDGKIVVAGWIVGLSGDLALARFHADGTLDNGFGTGGRATAGFTAFSVARAIFVEPNGKITVAGHGSLPVNGQGAPHFLLARFTPQGTLDAGFGIGGRVATPLPNNEPAVTPVIAAVTRQANGRYVAAGTFVGSPGGVPSDDILVARFHAGGSYDTSFGIGGLARLDVAGQHDAGAALVVQPGDGKIVVAGSATIAGNRNFVVVRYDTTGHLDPTFGFGGGVTTDIQGEDVARAIAVQPDGAFVVTGSASNQLALARYRHDGLPDASFGGDGTVMTDVGGGEGRAIALRANGQIVVAGVTRITKQFFGDMLVAQYTSDGALDTTFGREGLAVTDFDQQVDAGRADVAFAVAIQADDKIVAAGVADVNQTGSFAVVRHLVATRCGPGMEC
jgi:uncharacterized delta-60 repeat protein